MKGISNSRISHFTGKTGIFCNTGEKALLFCSFSSVGGTTVSGFLVRAMRGRSQFLKYKTHIPAVYGLVNYHTIEKFYYTINTEYNK